MTNEKVDHVKCLRAQVAFGHASIALSSNTISDIATELEQLRGNLSLAEEGLANAMQEIERQKRELVWQSKEIDAQITEIQRLSEEIRLMRIENDALVESVLSLRKALGARDNKETLQALRAATEPEKKT